MKKAISIGQSGLLLALVFMANGCVVEPRDYYYDHDHHRYYHEHTWHECGDHNDYCR